MHGSFFRVIRCLWWRQWVKKVLARGTLDTSLRIYRLFSTVSNPMQSDILRGWLTKLHMC
jgi:hypothetical protein